MNYTYHETDAHGALDALMTDDWTVEFYYNGRWWEVVPGSNILTLTNKDHKLRVYKPAHLIRRKPKREPVEDILKRRWRTEISSEELFVGGWMEILSALKAEILEEVKK